MSSPLEYRAAAGNRVSSAAGMAIVDAATGKVTPDPMGQPVAPIREASPESDDAPPSTGGMVSRSGDAMWFPGAYLKMIAANEDTILARNGEGLKLYDALLSDETAFSTLQQRRLAITSRNWEVAPGDDKDPQSVQAADDFRVMLKGLGFDRVTSLLHYGVWYGYAVGEAIYSIKVHDGRPIVWIDDIVVPDRRWFGFTTEGELRFLGNLGVAAPGGVGGLAEGGVVPDNKFVTIRTGGTHDFAFYGLGLAHWCYWPIFFKRSALKFWALYLEKLGAPTVAVEFTEAEKDDNVKKQNLLAAAVAVGKDSAVLLPEGTLKNERLKILESARNGSSVSSYKDFVTAQDEAIMRVVLGQPGTSKGVHAGLNSDQASTHAGVKAEIVKADSDMISEALHRTFATWVTRWNYGPDVAPPTVYRVLDDQEDLNNVAKRDVDLAGIGIKRTEASVHDVYGDGYELGETDPKASLKQVATALGGAIDPETGKIIPVGATGAAVPAAGGKTAAEKVAEFAAQGGDTAFSPLYVSRKLLNADEVIAWAKKQGFKVTAPAADLHVTILYSKTAVDWFAMAGEGWDMPDVTVDGGGPRFVERFGPAGNDQAVVLRFASPVMTYRHDSMIERGASSDFPDFKPHVTFSYDGADVDLSKVEPFTGALRFGPEVFEPIKAQADASDGFLAFTAADEAAIERLIGQLCADADPVFEAMATELRGSLQGVSTVEGARVAILGAMERLPVDRLAKLTALPMLAERCAASIGADDHVDV